jgi:nickel superoxide dismutase
VIARPGGKPASRQHTAMSGILVNRSSSPALPMFVPDGKELPMRTLRAILHPTRIASAHCEIPCGIYDPEQARIEAESCYKIIGMYQASDDDNFKARIVHVKEERAELVKHHLDVLWHDYFKPEHLQRYPNLHQTFWTATKQASTGAVFAGPGRRQGVAVDDRHDRRNVEGDRRPGEDARQRPALLSPPDQLAGRATTSSETRRPVGPDPLLPAHRSLCSSRARSSRR